MPVLETSPRPQSINQYSLWLGCVVEHLKQINKAFSWLLQIVSRWQLSDAGTLPHSAHPDKFTKNGPIRTLFQICIHCVLTKSIKFVVTNRFKQIQYLKRHPTDCRATPKERVCNRLRMKSSGFLPHHHPAGLQRKFIYRLGGPKRDQVPLLFTFPFCRKTGPHGKSRRRCT